MLPYMPAITLTDNKGRLKLGSVRANLPTRCLVIYLRYNTMPNKQPISNLQ